jgi:hypothetical protein
LRTTFLPHLIATSRIEFWPVQTDFLAHRAARIAAHQFLIDRANY